MAIADEKLSSFFAKKRVGSFSALAKAGKVDSPNGNDKTQVIEEVAIKDKEKVYAISNTVESENTTEIEKTKEKGKPVRKDKRKQKQSVSVPLAVQTQSVSKNKNQQKQNVSVPLADPLANSAYNYSRHLHKFSKKEQELILFVFSKCALERSLTSPVISSEELMDVLLVKPERLRNLVFRISKKGGISCEIFKNGPSACRIFHIDAGFYEELLNAQQSNSSVTPLAKPLATTISSSRDINNNKSTTELPDEWRNIKTDHLQKALNNMENISGQIFNTSQVKSIYAAQKLTAAEVQKSINHFAYGIENYATQPPYDQIRKPAGFLVDTLKNGSTWEEKRYLSPDERLIKKVYQNLVEELEANKKNTFQQWVGEDTETKREKFKASLPPNHYFGDNEFREAAWKEFNEKEWPLIVINKALKVVGDEYQELIEKLITLDK